MAAIPAPNASAAAPPSRPRTHSSRRVREGLPERQLGMAMFSIFIVPPRPGARLQIRPMGSAPPALRPARLRARPGSELGLALFFECLDAFGGMGGCGHVLGESHDFVGDSLPQRKALPPKGDRLDPAKPRPALGAQGRQQLFQFLWQVFRRDGPQDQSPLRSLAARKASGRWSAGPWRAACRSSGAAFG